MNTVEKLRQIVTFAHSQGARMGIQLAHAGRKASMRKPWEPEGVVSPEDGGWANVVAPSAIPFSEVSAHRATLEDVYLNLTSEVVEFRAAPPTEASR